MIQCGALSYGPYRYCANEFGFICVSDAATTWLLYISITNTFLCIFIAINLIKHGWHTHTHKHVHTHIDTHALLSLSCPHSFLIYFIFHSCHLIFLSFFWTLEIYDVGYFTNNINTKWKTQPHIFIIIFIYSFIYLYDLVVLI